MFCQKCGTKNLDAARFCGNCGTRLVDLSGAAQFDAGSKSASPSRTREESSPNPVRTGSIQRRIVVAQKGSAHYRSIQQAINAAVPNDAIVVKPGVYRESLVLTKPLMLLGDGPVGDIIIEHLEVCLRVQSKVFVKGLSFRHASYAGIGVLVDESGVLAIEDCDIFQNHRNVCVAVGGEATIRDCRIRDAVSSGVIVFGGKVMLDGCDIFQNDDNVHIFDDGDVTIRNCRIFDSRDGIGVQVSGKATIENSDIF